ncbi:MAG: phosphate-starvation-inducible PsiE family protein [Methanomicrobiaceae archaeon]|nr:phosphate-starvation-inducible PsiE family protein [Methanomicrobiaceae archaeon]
MQLIRGRLTSSISSVIIGIYLAIAVVLSLLALLSLYDAAILFLAIFETHDITGGILLVLHALLVTIIIIELLETVTAYFRTNRLLITPILIAGLTAMIRRVLMFGVEYTETDEMIITLAAIVVLTLAVIFIGRQEREDVSRDGGEATARD